ncbi:hypothetical protein HYT57_00845 [Candidatus Woesearchaeota archaeon]|nr:hypothetical protein [Candidatus Woesearchaeota archaeon]
MSYDIDTPDWIPDGLELWFLAKVTGAVENLPFRSLEKSLVTDEGRLYRNLVRLDSILGNGTSVEELRVCRDRDVREAYTFNVTRVNTRFVPYFLRRIMGLKVAYDKRIKQLEERQDLQEGYVGSN